MDQSSSVADRCEVATRRAKTHAHAGNLHCTIKGEVPRGGRILGTLSLRGQYLHCELEKARTEADEAMRIALLARRRVQLLQEVVVDQLDAEHGAAMPEMGLSVIALAANWQVYGLSKEQTNELHGGMRHPHRPVHSSTFADLSSILTGLDGFGSSRR